MDLFKINIVGSIQPDDTKEIKLQKNLGYYFAEMVMRDMVKSRNIYTYDKYTYQEIQKWKIKKNPGGGDCMFIAIADILNGNPSFKP